MPNQFSLYDLLIIFGIVQGLVTAILLFSSPKNKRANIFLALTILSFSFLTTKTLLHSLHLWDTVFFRFFPNGIELALPPLIYFYAYSLIYPKFRIKKQDLIHFVPFFISQTYAFVIYFKALLINDFYEKDAFAFGFWFREIKQMEEYLLMISLVIYLFYGYKEINLYKKWMNETTSDSIFPDFSWLITLFRIFMAVGILKLVNHLFDVFFDYNNISNLLWNFLILIIAILIYYLGLKGLLLPNYTFSRDEVVTKTNSDITFSNIKISNTKEKLEKTMNKDKVFLNPKLTIHELSNVLNISERYLSHIINKHFKTTFRNYINSYRVEEVKSKLIDSSFKHMSILGIALESGFNSEASFYRIFKKSTGISPKEFIQKSKNIS